MSTAGLRFFQHLWNYRNDRACDAPSDPRPGCPWLKPKPDRRAHSAKPKGLYSGREIASRSLQGVVGEVYVGGARRLAGLSPVCRAARRSGFCRIRMRSNSGARLYRTGDLACWRANTEIDIVHSDAADRQVKVRGFRIEPGAKIEAVLATHRHWCAIASLSPVSNRRGDGSSSPITCLRQRAAATAAELRALCEKLLAPHMVPAAFVQLEAWPLTRNGKLDRGRLAGSRRGVMRVGRRAGFSSHLYRTCGRSRVAAGSWNQECGAQRRLFRAWRRLDAHS